MRRGFKVLMWVVLGPVLLVLLLALAWLAFNGRWADAAPRPVPPELQPQAVTLAPQDNAFFDIQGLRAPEGEAPNAWGQRAWLGEVDDARLVPVPTGDDWNCKADCLARWRASAAALGVQMREARTFGERCHALAARASLQEPPHARRPHRVGGTMREIVRMPNFSAINTCLRWVSIEAVLAPDAARAQAAWARADALLRLVSSGTQSLLGQAVSWSWVLRHQQLLAAWSAQQPAGTELTAAWLAPMPQRLLQPRLWMAAEAAYQREVLADLRDNGGAQLFDIEPNALQAWAGRHSLGFLPNLTQQAMEDEWMADVRRFGHLQGSALASAARSRPAPDASWWRSVSWRNSVGHILIAVGRPHYEGYALRQADLVLSQTALGLSQQLNALPPAERAAWWARQPLDAAVRERLSLEADALLVRTWRGEVDDQEKAPLRFPLRPA